MNAEYDIFTTFPIVTACIFTGYSNKRPMSIFITFTFLFRKWCHSPVSDVSCPIPQKMLAGYIMSRVCLRWDYFFRLPFCIYRVACVELAHSSLGDWKNIFITHLIIIIKSEVSTFPIVVIFFRGCVSEMVVLSYSVIYYIYIPGKLGLFFHFWCSVYGICKRSDTLWPVGRVRLFADYIISLSSLCKLIWRHWTTKCLSGICCRVCV